MEPLLTVTPAPTLHRPSGSAILGEGHEKPPVNA
jgi:hypothetical protein